MKIIDKVRDTVSNQAEIREERIRQKEEEKRKKLKKQRITTVCSLAVLVIIMFGALGISSVKKNSKSNEQAVVSEGVTEAPQVDVEDNAEVNENDSLPSSTEAETQNGEDAQVPKTGKDAYNFTGYYEEKYSTIRASITHDYFFDLENGVKVSYTHGKDHGKVKKSFFVSLFEVGDDQKLWAYSVEGEPYKEYYIYDNGVISYYRDDGTLIQTHVLHQVDDIKIRTLEASGFFDEYPTPEDLR